MSTQESCQRNLDCVSTRGRIISNPEKVWAKGRDTQSSNKGITKGYSGSDPRETTGGFWNHRPVMDIRTNEAVYPKTMEKNRKRADSVGLHEALGDELPASGEARAETESYRYLKVEKRGVSCNRKACESRKCNGLLGR